MRYGDRLDYQIRIPEELKKLYTVKLLIQPLAENSIYHGIKESDRKGTILITAGEEPGGSISVSVMTGWESRKRH